VEGEQAAQRVFFSNKSSAKANKVKIGVSQIFLEVHQSSYPRVTLACVGPLAGAADP
jgi:hypothetical protein